MQRTLKLSKQIFPSILKVWKLYIFWGMGEIISNIFSSELRRYGDSQEAVENPFEPSMWEILFFLVLIGYILSFLYILSILSSYRSMTLSPKHPTKWNNHSVFCDMQPIHTEEKAKARLHQSHEMLARKRFSECVLRSVSRKNTVHSVYVIFHVNDKQYKAYVYFIMKKSFLFKLLNIHCEVQQKAIRGHERVVV